MSNTLQADPSSSVPTTGNFAVKGQGAPVILIHGIAASLHAWDFLIPDLVQAGYSTYALDLLGHGDSPKPDSRSYRMEWLFEHFASWCESLDLDMPAVIVGHSLGGYIALEYARLFPEKVRGLVLVNPFYSLEQLPGILRLTYGSVNFGGMVTSRTPGWMFRIMVDLSSLVMGHGRGGLHALPEAVRAQTAADYIRTAPGVYSVPNVNRNLDPYLASIGTPALVLWGDRDRTLAPASFPKLVAALPGARGACIRAGHVPHQSNPDWLDPLVLQFIRSL
jgi:pimeloyl-ACP methyl ester carboxylesterase